VELTVWTYEGPSHVGAMRVAASLTDVHLLLHAPQGDTYADLLFTMIARQGRRPPVSYTTFAARHLGGGTAERIQAAATQAVERFRPSLLLVGDTCTAELLQDQAGTLAARAGLPVPVVPLELSSWSRKEGWGASETFYRVVRQVLADAIPEPGWQRPPLPDGRRPRANLLGPTALGFRCRDDVAEVTRLLEAAGVDAHVVAPLGASVADLRRLPEADLNICLYPETARTTCAWLERTFRQPAVHATPIGVGGCRDFLAAVHAALGRAGMAPGLPEGARLPWYSRSVDATYLTGKQVFVYGDATHAVAAARVARDELGFDVVGLGTYTRELARDVRRAASEYGVEPLVTDDYLEVERRIAELQPDLVLGTQMERHIAKRLGIPCAVISAPVHVQDFPARYAPQMGVEGTNVLFDSWVQPLMMGLEEHLLTMFRGDFEFGADAPPSHLGSATTAGEAHATAPDAAPWAPDAEAELRKVPFFVRGKARRNTERYARERGVAQITVETLYEAKAHFSR
jgi:light-independent protochlorophyllide reductase subunit B